MVTTVTCAVPRPAQNTTALLATVVVLVVLSFPIASGLHGSPAATALPAHGLASAVEEPGDQGPADGVPEGDGQAEIPKVGVGTPATNCDQRSVIRPLPDAVPSGVLRLVVWDQPWWPLLLPHPDLGIAQTAAGELPPTRGPPAATHTAI